MKKLTIEQRSWYMDCVKDENGEPIYDVETGEKTFIAPKEDDEYSFKNYTSWCRVIEQLETLF